MEFSSTTMALWLSVFATSMVLLVVGLRGEYIAAKDPDFKRRLKWSRISRISKYSQFYLAVGFWWAFILFETGWLGVLVIGQLYISTLTSASYMFFGVILTATAYIAVIKLKQTNRRIYGFKIGWQSEYPDSKPPTNVVTDVTHMKYLGLSNLAILIASVPVLAFPEEMIFREYAFRYAPLGFKVAFFIFVSIFVFSLVHIISGYDMATLLVMAALTAAAMTWAYAIGGIMASLQLHIAINLVAIPFYGGTHNGREVAGKVWTRGKLMLATAYGGLRSNMSP